MCLILLLYLITLNVFSFIIYGLDKHRARIHAWRIPEKTLFLLALIGGSAGAFLGMKIFRHKTRHWYFRYGLPLILLMQVLIIVWLWYKYT